MNKSELKKGEYYTSGNIKRSNCEDVYIWICNSNGNTNHSSRIYIGENTADSTRFAKVGEHYWNQHRLATPEEKHWLDECIRLNKFVTKEIAMETFNFTPKKGDYLYCHTSLVMKYTNEIRATVGKYYKCEIDGCFTNNDGNKHHGMKTRTKEWFRSATKEEYDAQFVVKEPIIKTVTTTIDKYNYSGAIEISKGTTFEVTREFENSYEVKYKTGHLYLHKCYFEPQIEESKEPEFVLPEKWVLHVDIANLELAKSFIHNHKNDYKGYRGSWTISLDGIPCYLHYPQVPDSNAHSSFQIQKDYVEITTEQFKKYVLKEGELQQPSKDASIEEILEYCKKKYPIGIEIKSVYNTLGTCSSIAYIQDKRSIFIESETKNKSLCIYSGAVNKYATIIEPVKQESPIKLAEQGHKLYSLEELTKALTKEYDKIDVEDILKVIKTIK